MNTKEELDNFEKNINRLSRHAVRIPVISNGNIQCLPDVFRCLQITEAHAVMAAEGNLYNPALFADIRPVVWDMATEYLQLVQEYPCPSSYIRGHLFKLFQHLLSLEENFELRVKLGSASTIEDFAKVTDELKNYYLSYHEGTRFWPHTNENNSYNLVLPPWLCQSYVRMAPEEHLKKVEEKIKEVEEGSVPKRHYEDPDGNQITRKRMKKLRRIMRRPEKINAVQMKRGIDKCSNCANTLGYKCMYKLCKKCCRSKCYNEELDCAGHRILVKTRRQLAKHYASLRDDPEDSVQNIYEISGIIKNVMVDDINNSYGQLDYDKGILWSMWLSTFYSPFISNW